MQTQLADFLKNTPEGEEAEAIVRKCVHCGFCLATCPTYQLLGDELDSPRGRIYLMKQVLEGAPVTQKTQLHLDRCLTCRNCETTCPSGVQYGRLVDLGRAIVEKKVPRSTSDKLQRALLRKVVPNQGLFNPLLKLGQFARPFLPGAVQRKVPRSKPAVPWPAPRHSRKMLVLDGCVQPAMEPNINAAAARLLDKLGISLIKAHNETCCGALAYHLNEHEEGMDYMRRNIDAWWPHIERGVEAIVISASGCGAVVKEYGHILRRDQRYAEKAQRVSELMKDVSEVVSGEAGALRALIAKRGATTSQRNKVAFHPPCTLQHGLKIRNVIEPLLVEAGFELTYVPDNHLCCGSAGTYSILQPDLSQRLLKNKTQALESGKPDVIATANIGCLSHIQTGTSVPVRHWVEVLNQSLV